VRTLVGELESVLQELASIAGVTLRLPVIAPRDVTAQDDVDELIAGYASRSTSRPALEATGS
jgi:hypothetical protein